MSKNVIICAVGTLLGFVLGFLITNAVTRPGAFDASDRAASSDGGGQARPLKPEQMSGDLPPGHPAVADSGGAGSSSSQGAGGSGSAASTSAEAQAAMDKADRAPKDFQSQAEAARVFYDLHDFDKATLYGSRALALKGNDFDALVLLGNVRYDAQDFAAAQTFYERALAVRPDSPDVRTDLGNTYFNRKDYDRAVAEYRKSAAMDTNHLNTWKNMAAAALQKNDKALLQEAVSHLTQIAPQSSETEAYKQKLSEMQ
jgi:tetratricopeptide (TPR) repeat protein